MRMTRALTLSAVSLVGGLLLWWIAAMAGMAIFSGLGIPASLSLVPGYLYTYVVWGTFFAVRFLAIGWGVCVVVVGAIVLVATGRRGPARPADPRIGPTASDPTSPDSTWPGPTSPDRS